MGKDTSLTIMTKSKTSFFSPHNWVGWLDDPVLDTTRLPHEAGVSKGTAGEGGLQDGLAVGAICQLG